MKVIQGQTQTHTLQHMKANMLTHLYFVFGVTIFSCMCNMLQHTSSALVSCEPGLDRKWSSSLCVTVSWSLLGIPGSGRYRAALALIFHITSFWHIHELFEVTTKWRANGIFNFFLAVFLQRKIPFSSSVSVSLLPQDPSLNTHWLYSLLPPPTQWEEDERWQRTECKKTL